MKIYGMEKLSLVDFDGKIATTLFTGSCNFRCGFCHNSPLVLDVNKLPYIPETEIFSFLTQRQGIIEGVCISGGEPTLCNDLPEFCAKIKALGYPIKLDTNGTNPKMLETLVKEKLIDYVAMDIKNSPEGYAKTAGTEVDMDAVGESVRYLLSGAVDYEFRTTVVKGYHTEADFQSIGRWIKGANAYFIQCFKDSGDIIEKGLEKPEEIEVFAFLEAVKPYVPNAQIRG